ncbi:Histone deacetylase complex subunit [Coemansia sp. Benny D115]|nr:Histone deacetylase complex subunit [Coemansia sp. Benny D115]
MTQNVLCGHQHLSIPSKRTKYLHDHPPYTSEPCNAYTVSRVPETQSLVSSTHRTSCGQSRPSLWLAASKTAFVASGHKRTCSTPLAELALFDKDGWRPSRRRRQRRQSDLGVQRCPMDADVQGNHVPLDAEGSSSKNASALRQGDAKEEEQKQDASEDAGEADEQTAKDNGNDDGEEEEEEEEEEDSNSGSDSDSDDENEDDGEVRCVCGERNDGELMIQCEICQVWQHTLCMGIRDEAHIPDKYYCEKCRPEDHPYINSRPRTVVLAEAAALGTSTMMRRSAVMAVAKMTAREEYRTAAAAAAIAASVAAATVSTGRMANGAKKAKKQQKKSESRKPVPKKNKKSSSRNTDNGSAEASGDEGTESGDSRASGTASVSASASADGGGVLENGSTRGSARNKAAAGQTPKRATGALANGSTKRRRVTLGQQPGQSDSNGVAGGSGSMGDEESQSPESNSAVLRTPGGKTMDSKRGGRTKTPKSRNRSISTIVKGSSAGDTRDDLAQLDEDLRSPSQQQQRRRQTNGGSKALLLDESDRDLRRGQSAPGSPRQHSPSSPPLQALLYGTLAPNGGEEGASDDEQGAGVADGRRQQVKRRRTGGGVNSVRLGGKQQRMTVSATTSPYIGEVGAFGESFAFQQQRNRAASAAGALVASSAVSGNGGDTHKDAASFGAGGREESENSADEKQANGALRPKHNFPPKETVDVDGNSIIVPSNMLNSHGQPIYSSVTAETMCKIRYPHSKASIYELNRRAKQLLEWLGKTQSEYEHERLAWLVPLGKHKGDCGEPGEERVADAVGRDVRAVSEVPTSPINPSDWPNEDDMLMDGEPPAILRFENEGAADPDEPSAGPQTSGIDDSKKQKHPRSTLSLMEDLMWRLIRFQETYST